MANIKEIKDKSLASIDSAICLLDKLPELNTTNIDVSSNMSVNPFEYLMDLLKRTKGYDGLVTFLSKCIISAVSTLEPAVKTALITHIKGILSCSVNPFISYEILRKGLVFNLRSLDLIGMMAYSPISSKTGISYYDAEPGKFLYFGCDEYTDAEDLLNAQDFNAFVWYVKNCTKDRAVWLGTNRLKKMAKNGDPRPASRNCKQRRTDGVVTLEYSDRASNLKDAEGFALNMQVPYNNCLHMFIGNTAKIDDNTQTGDRNDIKLRLNLLKELQNKTLLLISKIDEVEAKNFANETNSSFMSGENYRNNFTSNELHEFMLDCESDKRKIKLLQDGIKGQTNGSDVLFSIADKIGGIVTTNENNERFLFLPSLAGLEGNEDYSKLRISELIWDSSIAIEKDNKKRTTQIAYNEESQHTPEYRPVEYNYYYRKTLLQFNYDYVESVKLFDEKVVTAQLIDAITECMTTNMSFSITEKMIQNEVQRMVVDIVKSDDTYVNDCFFSFTNDEYNDMLEASQLQKIGIYGDKNGNGRIIDYESIMESLNMISESASKEDVQSAIEGALNTACATLFSTNLENKFDVKFDISFFENFMTKLAYVLVRSIISPKIYMLLATNLKIMGDNNPQFDIATFMKLNKNLFVQLIRVVRDKLLDLISEEVMSKITDIIERLSAKLTLEQFQYYKDLLASCINCIKFSGFGLNDWNMDNVDYADIYETESEPTSDDKC